MLRIGDFSKLSLVSIKALRLYDQMGLLHPIHVDEQTGYRYYAAHQLTRLNRILAFKDLGFSLNQIIDLLNDEISLSELRRLMQLKQAELSQHIETEQARLARVQSWLGQLERLEQAKQDKQKMTNNVVIKPLDAIAVVSSRTILTQYSAIGSLYNGLYQHIAQQGVRPGFCGAIWHDKEYKEQDVDGEAFVIVPKVLSEQGSIRSYNLPAYADAACIVHHGSYRTLNQSYGQLLTWIEENGYHIMGANRELYLEGGAEQDNESYVTEIQFPVAKE
ncbi:MerR family transcriptional regulator [Vacuolonema iberomarrocanum]|uniref:MerR family transcriptional regulator n=1 Tax=Vacuolonema iberomarrocanum TaxID=3454632 RepID=UPI0019EAE029|nr:MerR family transcriptional regulator [filamentous cyanobacterium LEGE 07170]